MRILTYSLPFLLFFSLFHSDVSGQTFCLKLEELSASPAGVEVEVFMQASSTMNLGSSNLQFTFDETLLNNPLLGTNNLSGFYNVTVTRPLSNKVSFNTELFIPNNGDPIAVAPAWTSLGTITFDVLATTPSNLNWSYNGLTTETVVFMHDEATQIFATSTACLLPLSLFTNLPVELSSFKVEWENEREQQANLNWTTLSETGNDHFSIHRSHDAMEWDKIGQMQGNPGSTEKLDYYFTDDSPGILSYGGYVYYKIGMVDIDGTVNYSPIQVLKKSRNISLAAHPNPFFDTVELFFNDDLIPSDVIVKLYDLSGKEIWYSESGNFESLDHSLKIHLGELNAGLYILSVTGAQESASLKIIKQ